MIRLVCDDYRETKGDGQTADEVALHEGSFSRFVLPFTYDAGQPVVGASAALARWIYRRVEHKPERCNETYERLHYPTVETAHALYRRANWYQLKRATGGHGEAGGEPSWPWEHVVALAARDKARNPPEYAVQMQPPVVVLFEEVSGASQLKVGFLIVDLRFPDPSRAPGFDDLLALNERFRYWRRPFDDHPDADYRATVGPFRGQPEGKSTGHDGDQALYLDWWASLLSFPSEGPTGGLRQLIAPGSFKRAVDATKNPLIVDQKGHFDHGWSVYSDNRAFVWTCAVLGRGAADVAVAVGAGTSAKPHELGHWVKLLNVDPPGSSVAGTHEVSPFERAWAKERTYRRWAHYGTVYGFTTHSGAALIAGGGRYVRHFRELYFEQALLLLYVRMCTFRFSRALSVISGEALGSQAHSRLRDSEWRLAFDGLRREFALFTNLYLFPLVSNQQQGIELYALARKHLDVEELFREVEAEIAKTHEYFDARVNQRQVEVGSALTLLATIGLPLALLTGFYGMNVIPEFHVPLAPLVPGLPFWVAFALTYLAGVLLAVGLPGVLIRSGWLGRAVDWLASRVSDRRGGG